MMQTFSTTDSDHPLWLSYAPSCSQRHQMPSKLLQLGGLSLEPVVRLGYLTASAEPKAPDSLNEWEGCQQYRYREREKEKEMSGKVTVLFSATRFSYGSHKDIKRSWLSFKDFRPERISSVMVFTLLHCLLIGRYCDWYSADWGGVLKERLT